MANRIVPARNIIQTWLHHPGAACCKPRTGINTDERRFSESCHHERALLKQDIQRSKLNGKQFKRSLRLNTEIQYITPFSREEAYDIHDMNYEKGPIIIDDNAVDYLIVGGGIMGLALAYNIWRGIETLAILKATKYMAPKIMVVEKDPTLSEASTPRSVGGIRQQFSHPCNIRLSMESANFLKNIKLHLGLAGNELPDIEFQPQGYLFLATEQGSEQLMKNYETQIQEGAKILLMTKKKLAEVFPWINLDGIELGTYGLENEGWFDPWALMNAFRMKMKSFGVEFIHGEVVGFKKKDLRDTVQLQEAKILAFDDGTYTEAQDTILGAYIKTPEHDKPIFFKSAFIANCAGPWAQEVSNLAGIGPDYSTNDHPSLQIELPVKPRKRYVFAFHCPDGPIFDCPMFVDPSGMYFRRDGFDGMYICGISPTDDDKIDHSNLDVDYDVFYEEIWPRLAHRVPVFEKLKLKSAWAGYYDYNTFDQNAIIGRHPYYDNFSFLNGFSGHGIQMACAASECLGKLLTEGGGDICNRVKIDRFSFNRIINNSPMREINIV